MRNGLYIEHVYHSCSFGVEQIDVRLINVRFFSQSSFGVIRNITFTDQ